MKLVHRWLGLEIVFVHVGHGLAGAALIGIVAANVPWWFLLALTPVIVFSLAYWMMESRFVLPVARGLLAGEGAGTATAPSKTRSNRFSPRPRSGRGGGGEGP